MVGAAFEGQRDHGFDSYPVSGFLTTTMTRLLILSDEFNQLLKTGFEPRNNKTLLRKWNIL